jgi:hypothetical protein
MNSQIRIGHFSPDAPRVNVLVDGETTLENVAFGDISEFLTLEAGSFDVSIVPAEGGDAVIESTLDLAADTYYTVLAVGELVDIRPLVISDEMDADARSLDTDGETLVRFVHTSPDAPAVDVRVADGPTLFENVAFGEASEYLTVDASSYDISVVPAGSDDAVLSLSDVEFAAGSVLSVFATGLVADDSLDATLVTDLTADDVTMAAAGR